MKKAFTLIELIVVVVIVLIIGALVIGGIRGCSGGGGGQAPEDAMRDYVGSLYPGREIIGVNCVTMDSDGDGYVSCTATIDMDAGPDVKEKQINGDCARPFLNWNSGCRPMRYSIPYTGE